MLGLPKLSFDPVLHLALWSGSFRDYSGHGNHVTSVTAPLHWNQTGQRDGVLSPTAGHLNLSANPSLIDLRDMTLFIAADFRSQVSNESMLRNVVSGLYFFMITGFLAFNDGTVTRTVATTAVVGSSSIAIAAPYGGTAAGYLDAAPLGNFNGVSTALTPSSAWRILGVGGATGLRSPAQMVALYPGVLPAPEIAELHDYSQSLITPRRQWPGSGLRYPGRGDPYTHRSGDTTWLDGVQTARVSIGDETSGKLSNTGLDIVTGTWRVSEDATGRYFHCVGNGQIKRRLIGADAMTTRLFTEEGSATLTKTTTEIQIDALATDKIRAVQLEAA